MSQTPTRPERDRLETWLSDSEQRFSTMFELSGAGMIITRGDGTISFVNQAFAQMLGYTPAELTGRSLMDLAPPDQRNPLGPGIAALRARTATAINLERPYLHRDGSRVITAVSAHALPVPPEFAAIAAQDKTLHRFIGIAHDITARRRAEAHLRENQRLLEEAQRLGKIGHWTWTAATNRVSWSAELYRILGLEPETTQHKQGLLMEFMAPEDAAIVREASAYLVEGHQDTATLEFRVRRTDGEFRDIIGRSAVGRSAGGNLLAIVGTMQDITERKRQEAVLHEAMIHAETANRAKTKFLAAMSHELRTPLNAVLGFAQLLSLRTQGPLTTVQSAYVNNIIQGGEHLLHLINDVLDLARIDTGNLLLNLDRVEVDAVIQDVVDDMRPMADTRAVTMHVAPCAESAAIAMADRTRLMQVLVNLASNAIKYNRPQGSVTFTVHRPCVDRVRIGVQDTGRGIPENRQGEVFESFNRLGAEASGEEGTGIGLSLSKRLVEEMGGAIGFKSTPGEGSLFWIDLPGADEPPPPVIAPADARSLAG